jgi:hypothetical protein
LQDIQLVLFALQKALLDKLGNQVNLVFQYGSRIRKRLPGGVCPGCPAEAGNL